MLVGVESCLFQYRSWFARSNDPEVARGALNKRADLHRKPCDMGSYE
jgi:hypothetical protein